MADEAALSAFGEAEPLENPPGRVTFGQLVSSNTESKELVVAGRAVKRVITLRNHTNDSEKRRYLRYLTESQPTVAFGTLEACCVVVLAIRFLSLSCNNQHTLKTI